MLINNIECNVYYIHNKGEKLIRELKKFSINPNYLPDKLQAKLASTTYEPFVIIIIYTGKRYMYTICNDVDYLVDVRNLINAVKNNTLYAETYKFGTYAYYDQIEIHHNNGKIIFVYANSAIVMTMTKYEKNYL